MNKISLLSLSFFPEITKISLYPLSVNNGSGNVSLPNAGCDPRSNGFTGMETKLHKTRPL